MTASIAERAFQLLCEQHTRVVIDTETTPSAADGDHIVQLAAVTVRQGRIRGTYATEVNPGVPIMNSQFHNVTDADVAGRRRSATSSSSSNAFSAATTPSSSATADGTAANNYSLR